MSEWFKEWFASDEYLDVYKHRDTGDAKSIISLIHCLLKTIKKNHDMVFLKRTMVKISIDY